MNRVISRDIARSIEESSWIRRMFEDGARLKAEHGAENVFDFTLGNPVLDPPERLHEVLVDLLRDPQPGMHRYVPNAGIPEVREHVADLQREDTGLPFEGRHVVMTTGAAGAMNIVCKALLDPGDEVVAFAPYFREYDYYAANHGGRLVAVPTGRDFQIDLEALDRALNERTRIVLVNTPNNPTGVVYPAERLQALADCLQQASQRHGRPIFLVSDEPYRKLTFDGVTAPPIPPLYAHTIVVSSFSKDLGIAGERLGYAAVSPQAADAGTVADAMVTANRILGYVNAPALMQRAIPHLRGLMVDVGYYRNLRDRMVRPLQEMGYEVVNPQGAFYLFPRAPIDDDVAFVRQAQAERLLVVPGSGFAGPGHFRVALTVTPEVVERALPVFAKVLRQARG